MSTDKDISLAIVAYGSLLLKIIIIIIIINKGWSRFLYNMKSQPYLHQVHHPKKKKIFWGLKLWVGYCVRPDCYYYVHVGFSHILSIELDPNQRTNGDKNGPKIIQLKDLTKLKSSAFYFI